MLVCFFFSSRRRHTRYWRDWSSDVCSSDLRRRAARFQHLQQQGARLRQGRAQALREGLGCWVLDAREDQAFTRRPQPNTQNPVLIREGGMAKCEDPPGSDGDAVPRVSGMSEAGIDYTVMEECPASDPAACTLGIRRRKLHCEEFEGEKSSTSDHTHQNDAALPSDLDR